MREMKLNYVAVGGFVIAMVLATVGSVSMMMGRTGPTDEYHLVLDNVTDIKFGTQVRFEGFPVGQVERIAPFAEGSQMNFRVRLSVREGWRFPVDSVARIGSSSFLAAKTVDISRGPSKEVLTPGNRIPSAPPADMFSLMANVAGEVGDLSRNGLQPLLGDLRVMVGRVGKNLEGESLKFLRSLNTISGQVERRSETIASSLESFTRQLDDSSKSLKEILSPANAKTIAAMLKDVHTTTRTFSDTSKQLKSTLVLVNGLIGRVDKLVLRNSGNVDRSLTDVRYALGSIARSIDTIMHNIDGSSRNLSEFSRLIRQNPGLLLGGTPREQVSPASRQIRN